MLHCLSFKCFQFWYQHRPHDTAAHISIYEQYTTGFYGYALHWHCNINFRYQNQYFFCVYPPNILIACLKYTTYYSFWCIKNCKYMCVLEVCVLFWCSNLSIESVCALDSARAVENVIAMLHKGLLHTWRWKFILSSVWRFN